jgi:hypothetical protein
MHQSSDESERKLIDIARSSPWFMRALRAVCALELDDWCIGAGAVRNLVWDALHGKTSPSQLNDIDVAYFDVTDTSSQRDEVLLKRLRDLEPSLPWEVTNQAGVHHWFESYSGHRAEPLRSLDEAVASWPEFATSVGLTLRTDGSIDVLAPHGLDDLFGIVIRRNPTRVSVETYRARVAAKRYAERWPMVRIVPC